MNNSPEKKSHNPEYTKDPEAIEQIGVEQREALKESLERKSEQSPEKNLEAARHEALDNALSGEQERVTEKAEHLPVSPERHHNGFISKGEREASFQATMKEVQTHMSAPSRAFSKIIHNKSVEAISEAGASTIARPNAILTGAIFAFLITLATYVVAKNFGYPLSGFETIGAFILGWIIGLVYDFLRVMITGRR